MNSVSVTGKNWILKKFDQEKIIYLKDNFFLDEITAKLLAIRNIKKEDISSFLNPSIKNFLPNPNNLLDMEKSSLRTLEAIKNKEKIGVFGDYDVDGATSTALLGRYFDELKLAYEYQGGQHEKYVPFYHNNDINNFYKQQEHDRIKKEVCEKKGIKLICIPSKYDYTNPLEMCDFILDNL